MSVKTVEVIQQKYLVEVFPQDSDVHAIDVNLPTRVSVLLVGTQGPQGPPGPAGNSVPTIYFAYGDATPDTIYTPSNNQVITSITVTVLTPFNGVGAKVSIGTNADPELLAADEETDLSVLGSYEIDPEILITAGTPIRKFITPGAGASQGQAMIQIEYATA